MYYTTIFQKYRLETAGYYYRKKEKMKRQQSLWMLLSRWW